MELADHLNLVLDEHERAPRERWPWAVQAAESGRVHAMSLRGRRAGDIGEMARKWGVKHGHRVEYRALGDVMLIRWSRVELF